MNLLLIVDDWEALERYEEKLSPLASEIEACPMPREGLARAWEKPWSAILLDLVLEDVTPQEALDQLKSHPLTESVPLVVVGSPEELEGLRLSERDLAMARPFEWEVLGSALRTIGARVVS